MEYPAVKMAPMASDTDHLRPYWHLVDAACLDQPRRIEAHRRTLIERTKTHPAEALDALTDIAAIAIELAVDHHAEHVGTCRSVARIDVLRELGKRLNR